MVSSSVGSWGRSQKASSKSSPFSEELSSQYMGDILLWDLSPAFFHLQVSWLLGTRMELNYA